jgi:hypothetical protein
MVWTPRSATWVCYDECILIELDCASRVDAAKIVDDEQELREHGLEVKQGCVEPVFAGTEFSQDGQRNRA